MTKEETLVAALDRAASLGYTKPHDVATAILVELGKQGWRIVRKPAQTEKLDSHW